MCVYSASKAKLLHGRNVIDGQCRRREHFNEMDFFFLPEGSNALLYCYSKRHPVCFLLLCG